MDVQQMKQIAASETKFCCNVLTVNFLEKLSETE